MYGSLSLPLVIRSACFFSYSFERVCKSSICLWKGIRHALAEVSSIGTDLGDGNAGASDQIPFPALVAEGSNGRVRPKEDMEVGKDDMAADAISGYEVFRHDGLRMAQKTRVVQRRLETRGRLDCLVEDCSFSVGNDIA